jgi:hypothetical protein
MATKTDYTQGLTIPDHIKSQLTRSTRMVLEADGHGISFNSKISAQMRYVFNKKDFGGSYPRSAYASWEKLLLSAMATYSRLAKTMPNSCRYISPAKGVSFRMMSNKNRPYAYYSWQVHYKKEGKNQFAQFYCGSENTMTTERKNHAEATAWHFRALYCEAGDAEVFSKENTEYWQTKKYYKKEKELIYGD